MEVGTEPGTEFDVGVAIGVNALKMGVVTVCVTAGDTNPDGVEACSVANRSSVGTAAGRPRLQARMKTIVPPIHKSFALVVIHFE